MRRKLLLARALLHQPRLLYLDEPSANLDIHSVEVIHRILRSLVAQGTTVLLTTHNMQEVEQVCDRVAILCKGKRVALDSPLSLRQKHARRKVDVVLAGGQHLVVDLDDAAGRQQLSEHVAAGSIASLKTRELDFHEAFLELTGTAYN
jgi:ABC-2 type transport system ATP-binding protein